MKKNYEQVLSGNGPSFGNNVSHAHNKTRRRFDLNLQRKRFWFDVVAAPGSDTCTQIWTKMGKKKGLSREEMVAAMMVARYMKQAAVNDTITNSLALLSTRGE